MHYGNVTMLVVSRRRASAADLVHRSFGADEIDGVDAVGGSFGPDAGADTLDASSMALRARQAPLHRPTAIAVHNNSNMLW